MSCDTYCMNHGCNRGPGCPAGTACHSMPGCKDTACPGHPGAARVARVGQRYQGPEPLRGSPWRRHLKELARAFLLLIAVMLATALAAALIA